MPQFCHLHNHTEYSLLDGAGKIERLVEKAARYQMPAIAISDHGNMYGVPKFVMEAKKAGIRPIIGSEFYLAGKSRFEKKGKENESGLLENCTYHQILFAKDAEGYRNLMKLSSLGFTEGYHYKPRIDKEILEKHCKGLVATTCCLASEINQAILKQGEAVAEEYLRYYLNLFGKDYYIEIQRHGLQEQEQCNEVLLRWAKKYNLSVIATNDVHYIDREDSEAHDLLLALQTGSEYDDPSRFRFLGDNQQLCSEFYLKTPDEMAALFHDIPQALENTLEVADKCTFEPNLNSDLLMPVY